MASEVTLGDLVDIDCLAVFRGEFQEFNLVFPAATDLVLAAIDLRLAAVGESGFLRIMSTSHVVDPVLEGSSPDRLNAAIVIYLIARQARRAFLDIG